MIISTDIKEPLQNIVDKINNFPRDIQSVLTIHGSSSVIKDKFYVSDIDCEYWLRYQNNKKKLFSHMLETIDFLLKNNMYFSNLMTGNDDRFNIECRIKKDGSIINYDSKKLKTKFNNLYLDKTITKDELNKLLKYCIDKPTIKSFENLKVLINKYSEINWKLEEIKKGHKLFRNKKINIYDLFMKIIFLSNFIFEFEKGKYILFDLAFKAFDFPKKYKTLKPPNNMSQNSFLINNIRQNSFLINNIRQTSFLIDNSKIYGENDRNTTYIYYRGMFKNYVKGKYLKMLKRLRSLLTEVLFKSHLIDPINHNLNKELRNPINQKLIKKIRYEIKKFTKNERISCLNQLKNHVDTIIILMNYKNELEIKRLIIELFNNSKIFCNYFPPNINKIYEFLKKYDREKMTEELLEFKKIMFQYLNSISLPELQKHLYSLKHLLPFVLELPYKNNN